MLVFEIVRADTLLAGMKYCTGTVSWPVSRSMFDRKDSVLSVMSFTESDVYFSLDKSLIISDASFILFRP